jgi:hypothetical protein
MVIALAISVYRFFTKSAAIKLYFMYTQLYTLWRNYADSRRPATVFRYCGIFFQRNVEPDKELLLANGYQTTFVSKQRPRHRMTSVARQQILKSKNRRPSLGNSSVKTLPRQRIAWNRGTVFYMWSVPC